MSTPSPEPLPTREPNGARWFSDHVHVHDSELKSYLRHAFPDARNEVDDVVQESYLRIWRSRAGRPLQSAKGFLFKVARHVIVDILRRRRVSPIDSVGDLNGLPVIERRPSAIDEIGMNEKVQVLVRAIGRLPPRGREVVVMRKLRGLSQKDVAAKLGISEKTVDEHLYRGMKQLGRYLREQGVYEYR